eukprot:TRINITY_DN11101_c0_g1_i3.p1 TRINITY_DN11101_c0_g1~~TRINITY_DN11101_c0_g1_i3.p1  ORF type:complete len:353 (-),score=53.77 TRINITY_DN11101_c0_g1_i3:131-1189(-)
MPETDAVIDASNVQAGFQDSEKKAEVAATKQSCRSQARKLARQATAQRLRVAGESEGHEEKLRLKQQAVIKEVLDVESNAEVLHIAMALPSEWLLDADEVPGNLYSAWAFGLLNMRSAGRFHNLRDMSVLLVFLCQFIAPLAVLDGCVSGFLHTQAAFDFESFEPSFAEWRDNFAPNSFRLLFLILFWTNGYICIENSREDWFRVKRLFLYLNKSREVRSRHILYFGAFMKCWTVSWCCIACYFVVGRFSTSLDVVYDAVGLLFVYALDHLGGDLVLVSEGSWPGAGLGWIEEHIESIAHDVDSDNHSKRVARVRGDNVVGFMFGAVSAFCLFGTIVAPVIHIMTPWGNVSA